MYAEQDQRRRAYLSRVFGQMRGAARIDIAQRALRVVKLWEQTGAHQRYIDRWRELLAGDVDTMATIVLADNPDAEELRHCMPFAGILSNSERAELRRLGATI